MCAHPEKQKAQRKKEKTEHQADVLQDRCRNRRDDPASAAGAGYGRTVLPSSSRKAHVPQSLPERIAVNGIMGILVHVDSSLFNRAASNASLA